MKIRGVLAELDVEKMRYIDQVISVWHGRQETFLRAARHVRHCTRAAAYARDGTLMT